MKCEVIAALFGNFAAKPSITCNIFQSADDFIVINLDAGL